MMKVVIVEDEELVRRGIVMAVDWGKMDCVVVGDAGDGLQGLELIRSCQPDLVITDIRMPRLDGLDMIAQLRREGCTAQFILLTAYGDFSYAQSAIKLGVQDYLLKPFEDSELEMAVEKAGRNVIEQLTREGQAIPQLRELSRGSKSKYVEEAIAYIEQNYAQPEISLGMVAQFLGLSEGHLSRIFKKEANCTFMTLLTNCRMHKAMELLKDCRFKVYEVAEQVGYNDTAYFSSLFKKLVGVTPSEYQDRSLSTRHATVDQPVTT